MGTEIQMHGNGNGLLDFTPEQRQLIRDTFANGASDPEFAVLLEVAKSRRLNPFMRQIYFVKRRDREKNRDVWSTQASIDGLRAIAQRTGLYAGQDEPEFEYSDDGLKLKCSKVRVYRRDWPRAAVGVAHFDEYCQRTSGGDLNTFWKTKPHIMLAKCAESLALRKAFPEDLSGLYTPEEMGNDGAQQLQPAQELPRISPHGEVIEGVVYAPSEDADEMIRGIEDCNTLAELDAYVMTPDQYERYEPGDRKRIGAASQRRKRQLSRADRELDVKPALAAEDDL